MKNQLQIQSLLNKFSNDYGVDLAEQQGTTDWFLMKLGVLSASNIYKIMGKPGNETRKTYLYELVSQVCTGDVEEINSKYLDWGKQNEPGARSKYEFITGQEITDIPFVFKDEFFREGCSPDGLVMNNTGLEIKCPYNPVHYIRFLVEDKMKPEYEWQVQFQIRTLESESWDFVQYHPSMQLNPIKILTIPRNEEMQKRLDDEVPLFIEDMDNVLNKLGIKFGEQWSRVGNKSFKGIE